MSTLYEVVQSLGVGLHHGEIGIVLDDHLFEQLEKEATAASAHLAPIRAGVLVEGKATTIFVCGKRFFRRSHVRH